MPRSAPSRASLTLKVGHWFEAHATGWAVALVPVVLLLLLAASALAIAANIGWRGH